MNKYIYLSVIIIASFLSAVPLKAQEDKPNQWSVGASFFTSTRSDDLEGYWGVNINGSYRIKLYKKLSFYPELSLYYSSHYDPNKGWSGGIVTKIKEFGMGFGVPVGFHLPYKQSGCSWDLITGPTATVYFDQSYKVGKAHIKDEFNRFMARWRFGVKFNFCHQHAYLKACYDITMTDYLKEFKNLFQARGADVFTVGIGYNF